jgi:hypothetical protein
MLYLEGFECHWVDLLRVLHNGGRRRLVCESRRGDEHCAYGLETASLHILILGKNIMRFAVSFGGDPASANMAWLSLRAEGEGVLRGARVQLSGPTAHHRVWPMGG